jgi:aryl-alcohol dehydrogenase-like predicted oxidoreductase
MQYRQLGRSGLRVSEISLGSWLTYGATVDVAAPPNRPPRARTRINLFDTDVHANGRAEESLREALRGVARHKVVIATKAFFPISDDVNDRGLSRKHLCESVEASLRRLGTDYVDLHQCHRADDSVPMDETVRAYEDLIRAGKVLYWGVSEWSAKQITDAVRTAESWAGGPISTAVLMLRRGIEEADPHCKREGIGQIVWSPMAQGVLTGNTHGDPKARARRILPSRASWAFSPTSTRARRATARLAASLDLTTSQLAPAGICANERRERHRRRATPAQIENASLGIALPPGTLTIDAVSLSQVRDVQVALGEAEKPQDDFDAYADHGAAERRSARSQCWFTAVPHSAACDLGARLARRPP